MILERYLQPAVHEAEVWVKGEGERLCAAYYRLASYAHSLYKALDSRLESEEWEAVQAVYRNKVGGTAPLGGLRGRGGEGGEGKGEGDADQEEGPNCGALGQPSGGAYHWLPSLRAGGGGEDDRLQFGSGAGGEPRPAAADGRRAEQGDRVG